MSKLIIQALDDNDVIVFGDEFDGDAFFEGIFVQVSDKLGLTKPTVELLANTKEALVLRRNRRLSEEQKHEVFRKLIGKPEPEANVKYDDDVTNVLTICYDCKIKSFYNQAAENCLSVEDIVNCLKGLKYSNIEDINELFEENKRLIPKIACLKFIKEEY